MANEQTIGHCPNCGEAAIRTGNEIACTSCDTIFVISAKKEATVKSIGFEERLKKIEDKVFAEPQQPKIESSNNEDDL